MSEVMKDGDQVTLNPQGDIVASAVEELRGEFKQLLAEGCAGLTVDQTGVGMIDSMGQGLQIRGWSRV